MTRKPSRPPSARARRTERRARGCAPIVIGSRPARRAAPWSARRSSAARHPQLGPLALAHEAHQPLGVLRARCRRSAGPSARARRRGRRGRARGSAAGSGRSRSRCGRRCPSGSRHRSRIRTPPPREVERARLAGVDVGLVDRRRRGSGTTTPTRAHSRRWMRSQSPPTSMSKTSARAAAGRARPAKRWIPRAEVLSTATSRAVEPVHARRPGRRARRSAGRPRSPRRWPEARRRTAAGRRPSGRRAG